MIWERLHSAVLKQISCFYSVSLDIESLPEACLFHSSFMWLESWILFCKLQFVVRIYEKKTSFDFFIFSARKWKPLRCIPHPCLVYKYTRYGHCVKSLLYYLFLFYIYIYFLDDHLYTQLLAWAALLCCLCAMHHCVC